MKDWYEISYATMHHPFNETLKALLAYDIC